MEHGTYRLLRVWFVRAAHLTPLLHIIRRSACARLFGDDVDWLDVWLSGTCILYELIDNGDSITLPHSLLVRGCIAIEPKSSHKGKIATIFKPFHLKWVRKSKKFTEMRLQWLDYGPQGDWFRQEAGFIDQFLLRTYKLCAINEVQAARELRNISSLLALSPNL